MRQTAPWMKREDERILEYLDREGWATPEHLSRQVFTDEHVSPDHVRERLQMLRYAGFVEEVWGDAYEITLEGMRYLEGDLDANHQPTPDVRRVLRG